MVKGTTVEVPALMVAVNGLGVTVVSGEPTPMPVMGMVNTPTLVVMVSVPL